ncbi:MAG TPA: allophanate hydrolase subunit 1 [Nocardioidaceae bacterium]|nr:allophanate hydrolase subunit 1 [Nocardioidaceae bacterium]
MRILRVGADSLLVEVSDTAAAMRVYDEALRREVDVADVVPAARTVLFSGVPDPAALESELSRWRPDEAGASPRGRGDLVEVPTVYDGPELEAVARHWGLTPREVVDLHTSVEMTVAFCGFAPGFAYCTGLDMSRPVPRLEEPRTRVPAGAVGLADVFTGVYPSASPGGWQLIGRTDLVLWDESRERPATLAPGTRVRFVEVSP